MYRNKTTSLLLGSVVLCLLTAAPAHALLPVSGWYNQNLTMFDDLMQTFMAENNLSGGVLAISRNGTIIYQRGFGYLDNNVNGPLMAENTPMRLASVEKPLTSAAIWKLINTGFGELAWSDRVFNINGNGGILSYTPFGNIVDSRLQLITVRNCFDHRGGWDRSTATICSDDEGDPMFDDLCIAGEMGLSNPPNRHHLVRYMLGEPLQYDPGMLGCLDDDNNPTICYSNFGYMVLGRIVEEISGLSHLNYIRSEILTTDMWVPASEIQYGRSFEADQGDREPTYIDDGTCTNLWDPGGPDVSCPYGGHNQENFVGHGNLVASALPLLVYMDNYQVAVGGTAGTPLNGNPPGTAAHEGLLKGCSTIMRQRNDRVNYVALFNRGNGQPAGEIVSEMDDKITELINDGFQWPARAVDGFWVDFEYNGSQPEFGGYNAPFRSIQAAISGTYGEGVKLRFKPGAAYYSGTLDYKMRLDSPFGLVRIGSE